MIIVLISVIMQLFHIKSNLKNIVILLNMKDIVKFQFSFISIEFER